MRKKTRHYSKLLKIFLLVASVYLSILLMRHTGFQYFVSNLGNYGYLGAFITGIFWVFTYTIAPATSALLILGNHLNPLLVSIVGGLGAIFGDLVVFRFVEDNFHEEIKSLYFRRGHKNINRFFRGLFPILGALIIMSPFPDEWGVALMGLSNMNSLKFMVISLVLNMVGIFFLVTVAPVLAFK